MTATAARSASPPWAVTAWCDETAVFVELPCVDGPPYITRYPLSEAGLSKALWLMREVYNKSRPTPPPNGHTKHPKLHRGGPPSAFTVEQRESARNVLVKLKLIESK